MKHLEYCKLVKTVFSEEFERLEEYVFSMRNEVDCSEEKYWILTPDQDIPSLKDMEKVMRVYKDDLNLYEVESDEWYGEIAEIKDIWYNIVS